MRKIRLKEEQIIRILRDAEVGRLTAAEVRRKHGISEQTFYRWKQKYGGMEVSHARQPNEAWSMDFVAKELVNGQRLRALTIVDVLSREALAIKVDQRLRGEHVVEVCNRLVAQRRAPKRILVDNGSEFSGRLMDLWAYHHGVRIDFSRPRTPTPHSRSPTASSWISWCATSASARRSSPTSSASEAVDSTRSASSDSSPRRPRASRSSLPDLAEHGARAGVGQHDVVPGSPRAWRKTSALSAIARATASIVIAAPCERGPRTCRARPGSASGRSGGGLLDRAARSPQDLTGGPPWIRTKSDPKKRQKLQAVTRAKFAQRQVGDKAFRGDPPVDLDEAQEVFWEVLTLPAGCWSQGAEIREVDVAV